MKQKSVKNRPWSREDKIKLVRMRREGATMEMIGKAIGRNVSSIGAKLRQLGIERGFDDDRYDKLEGLT